MQSIIDYETVDYDKINNALVIIDQTQLPGKITLISLHTAEEIWNAIYQLKVRGAPAIGVAAAIGLAVLAKQIKYDTIDTFFEELQKKKEYLNSARPTAVNLSWALDRMYHKAIETYRSNFSANKTIFEKIQNVQHALVVEALQIKKEDIEVCRKIGEYGLTLIQPEDGILTHCNAGQLATCKYGTATAPIYLGLEKNYNLHVYADETRPLLQGARLTAYELYSAGVDVTLICDNMCGSVMSQGLVQAVFVGCDRVAANGDTANKIGTSVVAAVAKQYNIPFYVCAPTSTIDFSTPTGQEIIIEERNPKEVSEMWYRQPMTVEGIKIYNPAFDITDHSLITAFITEKGIYKNLKDLKITGC